MDDGDLDGALVTEVLNWVDGANERSISGLARAKRGEVVPLEDLDRFINGPNLQLPEDAAG